MFLIFNFWSWIFDKSSKFWAASCKNESNLLLVRFTVCIESWLPIGWRTFIWWKPAKVQLYFSSGCGMLEFFTYKPQSKEQLMPLPHLWNTVWRKRLRLEHMQTVNRTSRRIGFVQYSALLHLPPLTFHCAGGCWDRTQDRCNWCIGSQTL
jgi:hypothetical protein